MSDSNQVLVAYAEESTYRTVPSPAATFQNVRMSGEGLQVNPTKTESNEIDPTAQVVDVIETDFNLSGELNFEHSYGANDTLWQAAMRSSGWSSASSLGSASTIAFESITTSSTDYAKITDSANGLGGLTVGTWITVAGVANAVNAGPFKIYSVAAGEIELWNGEDVVDESAGSSFTITTQAQLVNGVANRSFVIEKAFQDTSEFQAYLGCAINSVTVAMPATDIMTGSFGILGATMLASQATVGDGSNTAAPTNRIMAAPRNLLSAWINGVKKGSNQFDFSLESNRTERKVGGTLGPESLGLGALTATGNFNAYFSDSREIDLLLADSRVGIAVILQDQAGNRLIYDAPEVTLTQGPTVAGSKNADVMQNIAWQAYKHPTEAITFRIVRIPAS